MSLNYVTITDTLLDGSGANGTALPVFTPSQTIVVPGLGVITPTTGIQGQYVSGQLKNMQGTPLQLLATDNSVTIEGSTGFWFWTVSGLPNGLTFSFFLPHSPATVDLAALINTQAGGSSVTFPITIAQGGTGQTAQQAALDALAGAVVNNAVLAGNGTHVTLRALTIADMPTGVGDAAWQFRPENYGAKGDGKVITDITVNGTSVAVSATIGAEGSAAVGKYIMIHGANGTASGPYIGTITAVSGNNVTLSGTAPTASVSNCPAVYGSDDTSAINAAVSAANTYALTNGYFAEVLYHAKIYILAGLTQTGNGTSTPTFNSQIPLPYPNANGTTEKLVLALTGAGPADHFQYWESTTPNLGATTLFSMRTAPNSPDATFGRQSIIGGPSQNAGFTGAFANVKPVLTNIMVMQGILGNEVGVDFTYCAGFHADGSSAHMFAPTGVNGGVQPYLKDLPPLGAFGSTASIGLIAPCVGNNADVTVPSFVSEGYCIGYHVADHFVGGRIGAIYVYTALQVTQTVGTSGTVHTVSIEQLIAEAYNIGIQTDGSSSSYANLNITMSTEASGPTDISDPGNTLHGVVRWTDAADSRSPSVTGAAHLKVIDCKNNGPGHMASPPAVPASTSAAVLVYRDAWVTIHTGAGVTVSAITVDGTATGLTLAASSTQAVRVPGGKTIALTYAGGTPTWDWWLD